MDDNNSTYTDWSQFEYLTDEQRKALLEEKTKRIILFYEAEKKLPNVNKILHEFE